MTGAFRNTILAASFNLALVALAMIGMTAAASATTIDFEDNGFTSNSSDMSPINSQGFSFRSVPNSTPYSTYIITDPLGCIPDCADNGTKYLGLYQYSEATGATMTQLSGDPFDLVSLDLSEMFTARPSGTGDVASTVTVEGALSGGGTVSQTFTLDGINDSVGGAADFQTFLLPSSFQGLTSATFSALTASGSSIAYFGVDNIVTTPVSPTPLPGSFPLFLTMLGGMGFLKWRRGRLQGDVTAA